MKPSDVDTIIALGYALLATQGVNKVFVALCWLMACIHMLCAVVKSLGERKGKS